MPTAKRASMREGPLAALFRKTAQDTDEQPQASDRARRRRARPDARAQRPRRPRQPRPPSRPSHPVGPSSDRRGQAARARGRGAAHIPLAPRAPAPRLLGRHPRERARRRRAETPTPAAVRRASPSATSTRARERARRVALSRARADAAEPGRLRVVGVGGAGVNAVNRMVEAEIEGVEFLADQHRPAVAPAVGRARDAPHRRRRSRAGSGRAPNPELGRAAAREEYDRIKAMLRGSDMVFIAAGAGGGTGTGAAPIVAQIARELGALTVGIVTRPFQFEGIAPPRPGRGRDRRRWATRSTR